jgi:hypothetical protein
VVAIQTMLEECAKDGYELVAAVPLSTGYVIGCAI